MVGVIKKGWNKVACLHFFCYTYTQVDRLKVKKLEYPIDSKEQG